MSVTQGKGYYNGSNNGKNNNNNNLMRSAERFLTSDDCMEVSNDVVLDTIDSVVACAEGVHLQHHYEERVLEDNLTSKQHGLTEKEIAVIRLQLQNMEKASLSTKSTTTTTTSIPMIPTTPVTTANTTATTTPTSASPRTNSMLPDMDDLTTHWCGAEGGIDPSGLMSCNNTHKDMKDDTCSDDDDGGVALDYAAASSVHVAPVLTTTNPQGCQICFQTKAMLADMPCCSGQDPPICCACVLLLCSPTNNRLARIGHCPRCRAWISVSTDFSTPAAVQISLLSESVQTTDAIHDTATTATTTSTTTTTSIEAEVDETGEEPVSLTLSSSCCHVCNQDKPHLVEPNLCDACFLGKRRALVYECKECHGHQRIPHPMYRYQPSMEAFGDVSWACQSERGKFTYWRILPDQASYIPVGDAPREWGVDDFKGARRIVNEAHRIAKKNIKTDGPIETACTIQ